MLIGEIFKSYSELTSQNLKWKRSEILFGSLQKMSVSPKISLTNSYMDYYIRNGNLEIIIKSIVPVIIMVYTLHLLRGIYYNRKFAFFSINHNIKHDNSLAQNENEFKEAWYGEGIEDSGIITGTEHQLSMNPKTSKKHEKSINIKEQKKRKRKKKKKKPRKEKNQQYKIYQYKKQKRKRKRQNKLRKKLLKKSHSKSKKKQLNYLKKLSGEKSDYLSNAKNKVVNNEKTCNVANLNFYPPQINPKYLNLIISSKEKLFNNFNQKKKTFSQKIQNNLKKEESFSFNHLQIFNKSNKLNNFIKDISLSKKDLKWCYTRNKIKDESSFFLSKKFLKILSNSKYQSNNHYRFQDQINYTNITISAKQTFYL
ncbi:methyl methanesulfonate sensitivity 4 [Anaeramoeba flamelloides]|uniref:Methyl methanesulfonate sensitivity 4 n=1 Tax=Anaeramoeba flamelloides TaxID=1746091 RepID=A0ABQ8Y368_9EUKA|nr:methyl methanesulfonate sensitivity 4 [Anaeramoeba flamelloides]